MAEDAATADVTSGVPAGVGTLGELGRRAEQGDWSALDELRICLDRYPHFWRQAGDLGWHAEMAIVRLVAGGDPLVGEALRRKLDELRGELLGPTATPLERLLVDRVLLAWAQCHAADLDAAARGQGTGPAAAFATRRQDSANRRYLAAIRELAQVRLLLRRAGPLPAGLRAVG